MVVGLVYVPLLLGGIGRAEYGLYQFIGSIIAYITIVNTTRGSGVTRFYCKYLAEGDEDGMANTLAIATKAIRWVSVGSIFVAIACMGIVRVVYAQSFTAWELDESCLLLGILVLNLMVTMSNTVSASVITAHEEFTFLKLTQLVVIVTDARAPGHQVVSQCARSLRGPACLEFRPANDSAWFCEIALAYGHEAAVR